MNEKQFQYGFLIFASPFLAVAYLLIYGCIYLSLFNINNALGYYYVGIIMLLAVMTSNTLCLLIAQEEKSLPLIIGITILLSSLTFIL